MSLFTNSAVTSNVLKAGDALHKTADVSNYNSYVANANMKGLLTSKSGSSAMAQDVFVSLNSSGVASYFQVSLFTLADSFSSSFKVSVGRPMLVGGQLYDFDSNVEFSSAASLANVLLNGGTNSGLSTLRARTLEQVATGTGAKNVTGDIQG